MDERRIANEDFDKWQQDNLPLTSDAETYQLVRQIAVDFSNAVFPAKVTAERDAATEQCCKDVCEFCANVEKWGSAFKYGEYWVHQVKANSGIVEAECSAAAIRSRVAAQGEKS